MDSLDTSLSILDIILCIVDIALICYLFFFRFPAEQKKKVFISRIARKNNRKRKFSSFYQY